MIAKSPIILLLWLGFASSFALGQNFPISEITVEGPRESRINLVIISEGYTTGELETFKSQASDVSEGFFAQKPFSDYRTFFNVYTLEVPSVESGCDHPNTASDESPGQPAFSAETYFNARFDVGGIHRLLVGEDHQAYEVLRDSFPDWDVALFLINHEWYGGSGGGIAAISRHTAAVELALHELGHSFAYLADEYGGQGGFQVIEGINVTAKTQRETIRWNAWIDPATPIPTPPSAAYANAIGLFEGANYHDQGWYRPHLSCKMRDLGSPFCAVCKEGIILAIYGLLSPITSSSPATAEVALMGNARQVFEIDRPVPVTDTHQIVWTLNGQIMPGDGPSLSLEAAALVPGIHEVTVQVRDTTAQVRSDPESRLAASRSWRITRAEDLPQTLRWLPHISRTGGGFKTQIYLRSEEPDTSIARLFPYDQEGQTLTPREIPLNQGELQILDADEVFGGESVSHVGVNASDKVFATVSFRAANGQGASAQVPLSEKPCTSATFYPGEWDWIFDGIALVNVGDAAAEIWVHQLSSTGVPLASRQLTENALLAPHAKLLAVLSDEFEPIPLSFFRVESSQPYHWVLLRGTGPGVTPAYLYQTVAETCR